MRLLSFCLTLFGIFLSKGEAIAQCTTCDGDVEVTFRGAMCAGETFSIQLHDKTVGPVNGNGCGTYTPAPDGKVKLKPDKEYQLTVSGSKVSTVHAEIDVPKCFKVYIDGEEISTVDKSGLGCTTYSRGWTVVLKSADAEGSGSAGEGNVTNGSTAGGVSGNFSLGGSASGSAGSISFSSGTISPDLFTPAVLNYVSVSPDIEVTRDSVTGFLRQIKAPEALADIVTPTSTSYEIRFYPIPQVGAKVGGLYQTSGVPMKIWRISPKNPPSPVELDVTEIQGAIQTDTVFSYLSGIWTSETGIRKEKRTETTLGNNDTQIDTEVFHLVSGSLISHVRETFHAFPWGTERVALISDPDGDALATTWAYHENTGEAANYGRLKWIVQPDGSWQRFGYYGSTPGASRSSAGKVKHVYRPWKSLVASPEDATYNNCHFTEFEYVSTGHYTHFQGELYSRKTWIPGQQVEVSYFYPDYTYINWGQFPVLEAFPDMRYRLVILGKHSGQYHGVLTGRISSTASVPQYLRGRPLFTKEPDGRQEVHGYEKGTYIASVFTPATTGDHLREHVFHTTVALPHGTVGKSLRTVRIEGPGGSLLKEETQIKTGTGYATLTTKLNTYDSNGRLELTTVNGRVIYEASWLNGRLDSETDEQGIVTTFDDYDAEGRVTQETRLGIVTVRAYDPAGNLTSSTRSSGGLSLSTSRGYDLSGRITSETSEDGLTAGTVYTAGGRISTLTRADTSTEITETYLDGQTQSITGAGVVARYFDYGADVDGFWRKESIGSETSPRYSQSWRTREGETRLTAVSGPAGPIYTTTAFDANFVGRPASRTVPGEAAILLAYDPDTGALVRQARDLNENGLIDEESDAIEQTASNYVEDGGSWFRETVSSRFETDGSTAASIVSTTREQLTGLPIGIASITESIDSQGHITTRTTAINRTIRTVTVTTDVPNSTLDGVEISVDGKLQSTTTPTVSTPTIYSTYDALGRPTNITSPRGVVTSTTYHPTTGQVTSVTHAGKQTSYTYYPTGSPGAGKVATETQPDTKVIRTSYTLRGEVFRVWGGATYPLERIYDAYGQQQFLKTYRAGTGWNGTTWPTSPGTADTTEWTYYEATGLLNQKFDAASKATTYTYQAASGKPDTRQRARGPITTYTWNSLGLPESVTHNDGTPSVNHTYDRAGRSKTLVDAAGAHNFTYPDELTTTETITGGVLDGVTRTLTLDTYQRLSSTGVTSGSEAHSNDYHYTTTSRLNDVATGAETATYGYLANSDSIQSLTFKSGSTTRLATTRSYDTSDRLDGVTHTYNTSQFQSFGVSEFDSMNRRKKITREDNTRWNYGYNDKGEVISGTRVKTAPPNTPVPGWSHAYSFDEIGNRKTATTNGRVSTYPPANALNQIVERSIPRAFDVIGKASTTATVKVDGNTTTRLDEYFYKEITTTNTGKIHIPYSVVATDANGNTTRDGGKFLPATPETFTHDFDGNLTSDGRFTYTWDAENRLIGMESHATVPLPARRKLAFSYDSMGRRISKTVWHGISSGGWQLHHKFDFIHELGGWNILAERSGGSKDSFLRTYTWGTDLSGTLNGAGGVGGLLFTTLHTSGKTFANAMDLNGNVTLLVNTATGNSVATYDYGPFGEPLRQSGEYAALNPFRWSTKYTDDETGLVDYGVRPYIPSIGRWLSRDSIEEEGGLNLYGFVGNDAVDQWDYIGWRAQDEKAMIDTVHKEGMRHHRESDDAYLAKIRSANPKVTGLFNEKQITYKPKQPQERGGFVCEKCTKAGESVKYSYYLTMKEGGWPMLPGNASVLLGAARKCEEDGGKQVGRWHTHPGSLFPEEKNKTSKLRDKPKVKEYHYFWNAGGSFSTGETANSSVDNPLFVITRSRITSSPWTYVTNMSTGGPSGDTVRESEEKPPEWVEDIKP